jgi:hypothetical protein
MSINATKTTEAPKTEAPKTEAPKTEAPKTEAPKTEAPKTEAPKTEAKAKAKAKAEAEAEAKAAAIRATPEYAMGRAEAEAEAKAEAEAEAKSSVYKRVNAILATASPSDIVNACAAAITAHFTAAGIPVSGATVRALNPISGNANYDIVQLAWEAAKAEDTKEIFGSLDKDSVRIARVLMSGMPSLDTANKLGVNVALATLRALEMGAREGDALIVKSAIATKAIRKVSR